MQYPQYQDSGKTPTQHSSNKSSKRKTGDTFQAYYFLKKYICICKGVREKKENEKGGERDTFYLVVHSPDGHKGKGWVRLNPGTRILTRVSTWGQGTLHLDHSLFFSGHQQGAAEWGMEQPGYKLVPIRMSGSLAVA